MPIRKIGAHESPKSARLVFIAAFFVAALMISNTIGGKIVAVGPLTFSAALFIFPLDYIFDDILTEVYGYAASRRVIWAGFGALVLMSISYYAADLLPSAPDYQDGAAFHAVLVNVPRICAASMIAIVFGEFANSFIMSKMKIWTHGEHLWLRIIGSTISGQGIDTTLFTVIAFYGILPNDVITSIILTEFTLKVLYEVVAMPLTYRVVAALKQAERVDVFDWRTTYNPFRLAGT